MSNPDIQTPRRILIQAVEMRFHKTLYSCKYSPHMQFRFTDLNKELRARLGPGFIMNEGTQMFWQLDTGNPGRVVLENPHLECNRHDFLLFVDTLQTGDRVVELLDTDRFGWTGTVKVEKGNVFVLWDTVADNSGCPMSAITPGTRLMIEFHSTAKPPVDQPTGTLADLITNDMLTDEQIEADTRAANELGVDRENDGVTLNCGSSITAAVPKRLKIYRYIHEPGPRPVYTCPDISDSDSYTWRLILRMIREKFGTGLVDGPFKDNETGETVFYYELMPAATLLKGRKYPPGLPPDYEILKNDLGEYRFRFEGKRCSPYIRKSAEAARRDAWDEQFRFEIDKKRTFYPIESDK